MFNLITINHSMLSKKLHNNHYILRRRFGRIVVVHEKMAFDQCIVKEVIL